VQITKLRRHISKQGKKDPKKISILHPHLTELAACDGSKEGRIMITHIRLYSFSLCFLLHSFL
jgi:hypothetical protein